ncbi:MAG: sensor histidine kinase [bacterium]
MNFLRKPKKISWKLTLVYAMMFFVVLVILNSSVYFFLGNYVENNAQKSVNTTLQYIRPQFESNGWWRTGPLGTEVLQNISEIEQNIYFRIVSYDGEIQAQSKFLQGEELPITDGFNKIEGENKYFVYTSTPLPPSAFMNGYLQIVRDMKTEGKFMDLLFMILVVTSLLGGVGAIFIGYVVTRKTLKPISEITRTVNDFSVSDLSQRLDVQGPEDELTELARTFNSMLDRMEEAFYRQQQFVSDASHELRTPISVIQGYIDLLDRWGKKKVEIRDEAIEAIKNEVSNIKSIMESLLFLARGDSEEIEINKNEFSVKELVDEVIKETSMLEEEIDIKASLPEEIKIFGDQRLIKQMLRIFVDNSIKYTPAGGEIDIRAQLVADKLQLEIEDTGCGIPKEDIPHIFERFYRVDEARSEKKGVGLGLSIARWIVEIHEGEIEVESEVGTGTKITVFLPRESENIPSD